MQSNPGRKRFADMDVIKTVEQEEIQMWQRSPATIPAFVAEKNFHFLLIH